MGASITLAGESLIAAKTAAHSGLRIARFVFANVPGLDPSGPVDRAVAKPVAAQIVHVYHLPRFGRMVAVPDAPAAPGLCDDFRPRFGVEVLLPDGEPDPDQPILTGLPLPAPMGGQEASMFGFPEEGTTVVVSFAYGLPSQPFITQILPHGLSLPRVPEGDQVWLHSEACQQHIDADGNWLRQTDPGQGDRARS